jgi:hypothetical protein
MADSRDTHPLLRVTRDEYGDLYDQHLLEQYKLYVESAERVSQRRAVANNFLLSVNAFLVTLYGLALSFGDNPVWLSVLPVGAILVCVAWLIVIRSYRQLNTAKFKVIHELEEHLPAALFDREWDIAERGQGKAYKPLTHTEPYIPLIFAALYVIVGVCAAITRPTPNPSPAPGTSTSAVETGPFAVFASINEQFRDTTRDE